MFLPLMSWVGLITIRLLNSMLKIVRLSVRCVKNMQD